MKPTDPRSHLGLWIIVKQMPASSTFIFDMTNTNIDFGSGFYHSQQAAEHAATIMRLKGEKVFLFELEIPL